MRSERPVPRLSNRISREKDASRCRNRVYDAILPGLLEMGDEARNDQEIERPIAYHLIGNAHVAALSIFRFWQHRRNHITVPSSFGWTGVVEGGC